MKRLDLLFNDRNTGETLDYNSWCFDNNLHNLLEVDVDKSININVKMEKKLYETVDPNNTLASPAQLDDLTRLHFFIRNRRVTTILEFGIGKSTIVFADALAKNKRDYESYVSKNLRRSNPFEIHSVDNNNNWINHCKNSFPKNLMNYSNFHYSQVEMTTFNGRACTMYNSLPNICPDFIYLDGPEQYNVKGDVRGISTSHPDRLPMSADILVLEPFLLPGTLIISDGRTANARFLLNNLQRNWEYRHFKDEDISAFELIEEPLGKINEKQIKFCLGK
jgi:hypothetical protein